jgi:hypothetical protein
MTKLDHRNTHTGRRPSAQLISDAVVASYIHDISQRHRRSETGSCRESRSLRAHQLSITGRSRMLLPENAALSSSAP